MADEKRLHDGRLRAKLLDASGLEGRFLESTFDSFQKTCAESAETLAACRQFVDRFTSGAPRPIWLIGPPGTGKTHLGSAMVRGVIERHLVPARIASAREIVRRLRGTWRKQARETEDEVLQDLGGANLLVLDEVGLGFGTDADQTQLFDVIDIRYRRRRPTVVLSNHTSSDIRGSLGDRLFDRLREGAEVFMCNWPSHRGTAGGTGA